MEPWSVAVAVAPVDRRANKPPGDLQPDNAARRSIAKMAAALELRVATPVAPWDKSITEEGANGREIHPGPQDRPSGCQRLEPADEIRPIDATCGRSTLRAQVALGLGPS